MAARALVSRAGRCLGKFAVTTAVEEVDQQAKAEPDEETDPGDDGEAGHQSAAKDHGQKREQRDEWDFEAAGTVGIGAAEETDAEGNENEGEESADVGEVGGVSDVDDAGGNSNGEAGDPGGPVWSLKFRVDLGKELGEKAITGHRVPDAGLSVLEDEDGRDHAHERADDD